MRGCARPISIHRAALDAHKYARIMKRVTADWLNLSYFCKEYTDM